MRHCHEVAWLDSVLGWAIQYRHRHVLGFSPAKIVVTGAGSIGKTPLFIARAESPYLHHFRRDSQ